MSRYQAEMFKRDTDIPDVPERLTPMVLQAAELLGLYRAELARSLSTGAGIHTLLSSSG